MYVGPTDRRAAYEIVRYACAAALRTTPDQPCSHIALTIAADHSLTLVAHGRYPELDDPAFPDSLTHVATAAGQDQWDDSCALAVLNALAERFQLELFTGTQHVSQTFAQGQPRAPVQHHGATTLLGRRLTFAPDRSIRTDWDSFAAYPLMGALRTLAALNAGLHVTLQDARDGSAMAVVYREGIRSYLAELTYVAHEAPSPQFYCRQDTPEISAEVALQWHQYAPGRIWSYVNGRPTLGGGSHVTALRQGLACVLDQFARQQGIFTDAVPCLRVRDLPPGLAAIISVHATQARYRDALGRQLGDRAIGRAVRALLIAQLPAQCVAHAAALRGWAAHHAWFVRDRGEAL